MGNAAVFGYRDFGDYGLLARLSLVIDEVRRKGETRLPAETRLCRDLEVSRPHLHRLLQGLARDGRLHQVRNKGWYFPTPKLDIPVTRHNSYTANMKELKKQPRSEVLGIDQTTGTTGRLWVLDFRRFNGELAFSLARVTLPVDLTPGLNLQVKDNTSLYQVLERHYRIRPERRSTWCEAVAADAVIADALAVALGSPLLKTTHEAWWDGKPFETTVNFLRADACRVRVDLAEEVCP